MYFTVIKTKPKKNTGLESPGPALGFPCVKHVPTVVRIH